MRGVCVLGCGWELDSCVLSRGDQREPLRGFHFKNLSSSSSFSSSRVPHITNTLCTENHKHPLFFSFTLES